MSDEMDSANQGSGGQRVGPWPAAVGRGFLRTLLLTGLAWLVPAISLLPPVVSAALGSAWSITNPWSWIGLLITVLTLTVLMARPIGNLYRRLIGRWTGIMIGAGYRPTPPVVQLSTGYWWNGYSYERSRRDAELDRRWRQRVRDPAYRRDMRWVAIAALTVGPVSAVPAAALASAAVALAHPVPAGIAIGVLFGTVALVSAPYAWRIVIPLARRWLQIPEGVQMAERVQDLEGQRADLTATQAAEIRRIERDLHDGAQARLVAVGLSLATAERLMSSDPERAAALLRQAREGTSSSLAELRELVRGVNPPVLVERGLVPAIRALALDSPVLVQVGAPDVVSLDHPVEAAVYFAIAELLTNTAKHAPSATARIRIRQTAAAVEVDIEDDGPGGAVLIAGGGLDGIRRRLSAFDGTLTVVSPVGGPTRVRIVVPCESS